MPLPRTSFPIRRLALQLDFFGLNTLSIWATEGGSCTIVSLGSLKPAVAFQRLNPQLASRGFTAIDSLDQLQEGRMRVEAVVELSTDDPAWIDTQVEDAAAYLGVAEHAVPIWTLGPAETVTATVNDELRERRRVCAKPDHLRLPGFGICTSCGPWDFRPGEFTSMDGLLTRWAPDVWVWADHKRAFGVEDLRASEAFVYGHREYASDCVFVEVPVGDVYAHPVLSWVRAASYACVGNPLPLNCGGDDGTRAYYLIPEQLWAEWCEGRVCGAKWHPSYDAVVSERVGATRGVLRSWQKQERG